MHCLCRNTKFLVIIATDVKYPDSRYSIISATPNRRNIGRKLDRVTFNTDPTRPSDLVTGLNKIPVPNLVQTQCWPYDYHDAEAFGVTSTDEVVNSSGSPSVCWVATNFVRDEGTPLWKKTETNKCSSHRYRLYSVHARFVVIMIKPLYLYVNVIESGR